MLNIGYRGRGTWTQRFIILINCVVPPKSNVHNCTYENLKAEASSWLAMPDIPTLSLPRISCTAVATSDKGFGGGPPPERIIMIPLTTKFSYANNNNDKKHAKTVRYIKLDTVWCYKIWEWYWWLTGFCTYTVLQIVCSETNCVQHQ